MDRIRAVFTDLDGTVLRNDKTISDRTMNAIRAFREKGGIWAVASARPERAISAMYKEFTEADALITLNGARIKFGDTIISNGFSSDSAAKALSAVLSHDDLIVVLETSKGIFGNIEIPEWDTPKVPDLLSLLKEVDLYKILIAGKEHKLSSVTIPTEPLCPSEEKEDPGLSVYPTRGSRYFRRCLCWFRGPRSGHHVKERRTVLLKPYRMKNHY